MNSMLGDFTFHLQGNFESRSTNENWCLYRDKLKGIENTYIVLLTVKAQNNDPWFIRVVRICLNEKKRAYRKASRKNAVSDWLQYKKIAKLSQTVVAEAKDKYFNSTLPTLLKTHPKKFWRTVNRKLITSVSALQNADGSLLPLNECAEISNKYFSYAFTDELPICDS